MPVTFKMRDPTKDHIVKWTVRFNLPSENGEVIAHRFIAHFKVLPLSETEDLITGDAGGNILTLGRQGNLNLLRAVLVGWDGIGDEDGQPVPFTPEMRDRIIDDASVQSALVTEYFNCLAGNKTKN